MNLDITPSLAVAGIAGGVVQLNPSGFGLSRHYPTGSHPTAFAGGSALWNSFFGNHRISFAKDST
jgi:hypothetical protein